jgi:hypothetical protein
VNGFILPVGPHWFLAEARHLWIGLYQQPMGVVDAAAEADFSTQKRADKHPKQWGKASVARKGITIVVAQPNLRLFAIQRLPARERPGRTVQRGRNR